jgi:hypothetical protein
MSRTNAVSQAYLQWRQSRGWSQNREFLDAAASVVHGRQVDEAELESVVELLDHRGLITGARSLGGQAPDPTRLTSDGVICVADFDGDVDAWRADRRAGYVNQPVTVSGQGHQVTAFSQNVQQNQRTEISNVGLLRTAAEQALAGLEAYELGDHAAVPAEDWAALAGRARDLCAAFEAKESALADAGAALAEHVATGAALIRRLLDVHDLCRLDQQLARDLTAWITTAEQLLRDVVAAALVPTGVWA